MHIRDITDIDVDWLTGNIYFTEKSDDYVGVCSPGGNLCTKLLGEDPSQRPKIVDPSTIAVAPTHGYSIFIYSILYTVHWTVELTFEGAPQVELLVTFSEVTDVLASALGEPLHFKFLAKFQKC